MTYTGIKIFLVVLIAWLFSAGCGNDDDDDSDDTGCSEDVCMAWCRENQWGLDYKVEEWGKLKASCSDDLRCICTHYPCYPENCDRWCKTSQDLDGGLCSVFSCECR